MHNSRGNNGFGKQTEGGGRDLLGRLIFPILFNAVAWTAAFVLAPPAEVAGNPLLVTAYAFPLLGLVFLGNWARYLARYLKWGAATFRLTGSRPSPGGSLKGVLVTKLPVDRKGDRCTVVLECVETRNQSTFNTRRSGKQRRVLWGTETEAVLRSELTPEGRRTVLPIELPIPSDAPVTNNVAGYYQGRNLGRISWQVRVRNTGVRPRFSATVEFPLLKISGTETEPTTTQTTEPDVGTEPTNSRASATPFVTDAASGELITSEIRELDDRIREQQETDDTRSIGPRLLRPYKPVEHTLTGPGGEYAIIQTFGDPRAHYLQWWLIAALTISALFSGAVILVPFILIGGIILRSLSRPRTVRTILHRDRLTSEVLRGKRGRRRGRLKERSWEITVISSVHTIPKTQRLSLSRGRMLIHWDLLVQVDRSAAARPAGEYSSTGNHVGTGGRAGTGRVVTNRPGSTGLRTENREALEHLEGEINRRAAG